MAKLEEVIVGSQISGITAGENVEIIAVKWYGTNAIDVTYKNHAGQLGSRILYREDEVGIKA